MHPYASPQSPNRAIQPWMIGIGVISALSYFLIEFLIQFLVPALAHWLNFNLGFLRSPSSLAIFGGWYYLFDKHLWKWKWFYRFGIVKTPNCNGTWKIRISPADPTSGVNLQPFGAEMKIFQTFSEISITVDTDFSHSVSTTASIIKENDHGFILRNEYSVEPKDDSRITRHEGVNKFIFDYEKKICEFKYGRYYTEVHRHTYGRMDF